MANCSSVGLAGRVAIAVSAEPNPWAILNNPVVRALAKPGRVVVNVPTMIRRESIWHALRVRLAGVRLTGKLRRRR